MSKRETPGWVIVKTKGGTSFRLAEQRSPASFTDPLDGAGATDWLAFETAYGTEIVRADNVESIMIESAPRNLQPLKPRS